ncbi:hypothetical protein [Streptomyces sp. NPDC088725]|uniref:hypothetical protein n=1 Tax=Streptomyces sp. NPDC088725 TaxID=3365873 RepID=UPI0038236551
MDFRTNTGASPAGGASGPNGPGLSVEGEFETRLTVRADRPGALVALGHWAAAHGLELTHIILDRGRTPSRPILTLRGTGTLAEHRLAAAECATRLACAGFGVVRTKTAAAPWNDGVPETDADASVLPAHCHFEHHITLRLPIPYDTHRLIAVAEQHTAHVSRAARRVLPGGVQERFVTQRVHGVGRPAARAGLDALLDALLASGYQPVDIEEEFVLLDDNPAVDSGWIEECERNEPSPGTGSPGPL